MIANRRERWLLWGAGLVVGALVLDSLWLSPLLARQADIERRFAEADANLRRARSAQDLLPAVTARLDEVEREIRRTSKGSALLDFKEQLEKLATKAGARSNTVNREPPRAVDTYTELGYRLDLRADIAALQSLLFLLDTSADPLKIASVTVNREGQGNDLKVTMRVSTITAPPGKDPQ